MSYQQLHKYQGSLYGQPQYSGMEFDYEVGDNTVIASPGGVSTTQHHYTKGVYGNGATQWDIFAGEGERYPYGELGNTYEVGQNAVTDAEMYPYPPDKMYTENQSSYHKDNFEAPKSGNLSMTPLDFADFDKKDSPQSTLKQKIVAHPFLTFIIILLIYASITLLVSGGQKFVFLKLHGGKRPDWRFLVFYGLICLSIALFLSSHIKLNEITD